MGVKVLEAAVGAVFARFLCRISSRDLVADRDPQQEILGLGVGSQI